MKTHQRKSLATAVFYCILIYLWGHVWMRLGMVSCESEGTAYLVFPTQFQSQLPKHSETQSLTPSGTQKETKDSVLPKWVCLTLWNYGHTINGLSHARRTEW